MNNPTSKIVYTNVNGLSSKKLNFFTKLIHNQVHDIIILAETWNTNAPTYLQHPYFIAHSIPIPPPTGARRGQGGILVLANPNLHCHISTPLITEHTIDIQIGPLRIRTGYYPPKSMNTTVFQHEIQYQSHLIHLFLADFNVRAHNSPTIQFPNNFPTPTSRLQTLSNWLYTNNFHLVPTDAPSGNDHVLATNEMEYVSASYSPFPPEAGYSDHGLLAVELPAQHLGLAPAAMNPAVATRRFHLRKLLSCDPYNQTPRVLQKTFSHIWAKTQLDRAESWARIDNHLATQGWLARRTALDDIEGILHDTIMATSEAVLGSYDVAEMKKKIPVPLVTADSELRAHNAIRQYKRLQRGQPSTIVSSEPSRTAMSEANSQFSRTFGSNLQEIREALPVDQDGTIPEDAARAWWAAEMDNMTRMKIIPDTFSATIRTASYSSSQMRLLNGRSPTTRYQNHQAI